MTRFYLDTSVAVHALRGTPEAEAWFDATTAEVRHELISSRLLQTELTRVLRRDRMPISSRSVILRHVGLIAVTESILTAAEAVTAHLKTLDAIHLASALHAGSATVVVTHDDQLRRVADELGLTSLDPLAALS